MKSCASSVETHTTAQPKPCTSAGTTRTTLESPTGRKGGVVPSETRLSNQGAGAEAYRKSCAFVPHTAHTLQHKKSAKVDVFYLSEIEPIEINQKSDSLKKSSKLSRSASIAEIRWGGPLHDEVVPCAFFFPTASIKFNLVLDRHRVEIVSSRDVR